MLLALYEGAVSGTNASTSVTTSGVSTVTAPSEGVATVGIVSSEVALNCGEPK